jgi:hypothetical protein
MTKTKEMWIAALAISLVTALTFFVSTSVVRAEPTRSDLVSSGVLVPDPGFDMFVPSVVGSVSDFDHGNQAPNGPECIPEHHDCLTLLGLLCCPGSQCYADEPGYQNGTCLDLAPHPPKEATFDD